MSLAHFPTAPVVAWVPPPSIAGLRRQLDETTEARLQLADLVDGLCDEIAITSLQLEEFKRRDGSVPCAICGRLPAAAPRIVCAACDERKVPRAA